MNVKETPDASAETPSHHWGSEVLDPYARDIPSLKFSYLMPFLKGENDSILDVGCGNGKTLRTIRTFNKTARLHGCDIREPSVPVEFDFALLETQDLPYEDAQFDIVLAVDVLEHVPDYKQCLDEILRVLKPGGLFLAFVPCEGNRFSAFSLARLCFGKDMFLKTKEHVWAFKTREMETALSERFELREVHYSCHVLGHIMDCTLFTLMLNKRLAALFWNTNKYYNKPEDASRNAMARVFNSVLSLTNLLSYYESRLLRNVRLSAVGLHVAGVKRL